MSTEAPLSTIIHEYTVSTVALSTAPRPRPLYRYVTLVRDSEGYGEMVERYATWAAARQGHARWVQRLRQAD